MRAGRLRHRVTLQRRTQSRDGHGSVSETWSAIGSLRWADIIPLRGKELFAAEQVGSNVTVKIRIRFDAALASLDSTCRVVFGSINYDIQGDPINVDQRNRELQLMCSISK